MARARLAAYVAYMTWREGRERRERGSMLALIPGALLVLYALFRVLI